MFGRRSLAASGIRNIVSDIELIPVAGINDACDRMLKCDVKYRFVLDLKTMPTAG